MLRKTTTQRLHHRAGLTLIEMLVVLALTLFIMTLFSTLFVQATGGMNNARGIARIDQGLRTALTLIRKDLNDVVLQGPTNPGTAFQTEMTTGGYFMLEENSPAIRQGLDQWGVPVEVDVDDVLAFTAERNQTSPQEVFYGTIPDENVEAIRFLDNFGASSNFDGVNDGIVASRFGEIVYFLRPSESQPTADQVRGHGKADDADTDNPQTPTTTQPVLYTLYRRQLVVLPDAVIDQFENSGYTIPVENYYSRFEISAKPDPVTPTIIRFNRLSTLDERKNRFGIHHDPMGTGADYPLSWTGPTSSSADSQSVFALNNGAEGERMQWFGRPISVETNLELTDFFTSVGTAISGEDADSDENAVLGPGNDFTAANTAWEDNATISYRHGEDILLENVLSFDIKVYDDDPRTDNEIALADSAPTFGVNPLRTTTVGAGERLPEFVDLGYRIPVDSSIASSERDYWQNTINAGYNDTAATPFYFATDPVNRPFGFPERWRFPGRALTFPVTGAANAVEPNYTPVRTYDTWSDAYVIDPTVADADATQLRPVPYAKPLKAIQIKIRVLEPKSGVVREETLIHRFSD